MQNNLKEVCDSSTIYAQSTEAASGTLDSGTEVDTQDYDMLLFIFTVDTYDTSCIFDVCGSDDTGFTPDPAADENKIDGAGTGDVGALGVFYAQMDCSGSPRYINVAVTTTATNSIGCEVLKYKKANLPASLTTSFDVTDASSFYTS